MLSVADKMAVIQDHERGVSRAELMCSEGWLWRFKRRHGIVKRAVSGEVLSADEAAVPPFVNRLRELREDENLHEFQIYNADETGLFWRTLPRSTQASKDLTSVPGHKTVKDRLSILVCANADGSHKLQPVIVGKGRRPRALKDVMTKLPVIYHSAPSAWVTQNVVEECFHKTFDPAVSQYQLRFYGIASNEIKALLILDNAPAHPSATKLCSKDGKIKALFLPANTTSLTQTMDQGVIESAKRHYRKLFLQRCLVVPEDGMNEPDYVDRRGKKTLENFKSYSIKDAIFNWAEAWKQVPLATLKNAWCKLLKTPKAQALGHDEFEGFEMKNMTDLLWVGNPVADHYETVRLMRMQIMKLQQEKMVQLKISSFSKPLPGSKRPRTTNYDLSVNVPSISPELPEELFTDA
ncbi:tigger transposable element-derived protein 7-like [Eriocheir sinensis]|uniref:tigger transposable element-derived protein 7-like n=1 Tax=Eriocheir sinensis TaxID=95602 RepID=UPI0021C7DFA0|nr:tigger transposable element-derived protein 7-like [Eriocheir sinensis]